MEFKVWSPWKYIDITILDLPDDRTQSLWSTISKSSIIDIGYLATHLSEVFYSLRNTHPCMMTLSKEPHLITTDTVDSIPEIFFSIHDGSFCKLLADRYPLSLPGHSLARSRHAYLKRNKQTIILCNKKKYTCNNDKGIIPSGYNNSKREMNVEYIAMKYQPCVIKITQTSTTKPNFIPTRSRPRSIQIWTWITNNQPLTRQRMPESC